MQVHIGRWTIVSIDIVDLLAPDHIWKPVMNRKFRTAFTGDIVMVVNTSGEVTMFKIDKVDGWCSKCDARKHCDDPVMGLTVPFLV